MVKKAYLGRGFEPRMASNLGWAEAASALGGPRFFPARTCTPTDRPVCATAALLRAPLSRPKGLPAPPNWADPSSLPGRPSCPSLGADRGNRCLAIPRSHMDAPEASRAPLVTSPPWASTRPEFPQLRRTPVLGHRRLASHRSILYRALSRQAASAGPGPCSGLDGPRRPAPRTDRCQILRCSRGYVQPRHQHTPERTEAAGDRCTPRISWNEPRSSLLQ